MKTKQKIRTFEEIREDVVDNLSPQIKKEGGYHKLDTEIKVQVLEAAAQLFEMQAEFLIPKKPLQDILDIHFNVSLWIGEVVRIHRNVSEKEKEEASIHFPGVVIMEVFKEKGEEGLYDLAREWTTSFEGPLDIDKLYTYLIAKSAGKDLN